ncbi:hypothetical protein A2924_01620 [Candidatus Giovannonibacteria bacterium RIFCSPLOWO2_01_FULL_44_16]|uniref:Uncharacterized protein n=1 Tax=Candidatus Giovannonibacteria bacterium RIFCSPLOWO2_01_FULL_44_16 TaxID=1798348 RepID=A0A1F5X4T7_9BACT|nr:MAG: hypothetical protein A2924_01620 [Candidatus Giovannonibacteria bacterium RIFCSPLOWO2_01_FULL_44_16]
MGKTRTILFAVLLASLGVLFASVEYGDDLFEKLTLAVIFFFEGVFILSLSMLIGATFFSLDQNGQIAKNTLAWKYFAQFHDKMPEQLKICPMFWLIFIGITLVSVLTLTVASVTYVIGFIIYSYFAGTLHFNPNISWSVVFTALLNILIFLVVLFAVFAALFRACIRLTEEKKWKKLTLVLTMIVLTGLYAIFLLTPDSIQWRSFNFVDLLYQSILLGMVLSAGVAIFITVFVFLILGCMLAGSAVKNTLLGQLVLSLYQNMCPIIPVETENQTEKAAT